MTLWTLRRVPWIFRRRSQSPRSHRRLSKQKSELRCAPVRIKRESCPEAVGEASQACSRVLELRRAGCSSQLSAALPGIKLPGERRPSTRICNSK